MRQNPAPLTKSQVKDEFSLVTVLSSNLGGRFQRSESSIMISITHSACLMYGGTFDPAYVLTISAVDAQCQAATNKRNIALIQALLAEILSVTPDRGVVKFQGFFPECIGTAGRTVASEMERNDSEGSVKRALTGRKSIVGDSLRKKSFLGGDRKKSVAPDSKPRKSIISMGRKESVKSQLSSIQPPKLDLSRSARSSTSSTPSLPSPVFIDSASLHRLPAPPKQLGVPKKSASTSNLHNSSTDRLLAEASLVLSQTSHTEFAPRDGKMLPQPPHPPRSSSQSQPSHARGPPSNLHIAAVRTKSKSPLPPPPPIPVEPIKPVKVSRRKSFVAMFRRDTLKAS